MLWVRHGHPPGAAEALAAEPAQGRAGAELDPIRDAWAISQKHVKFMVRAKKVQGAPAVRRTLGARVVAMRLKRGAGPILIQSNLSKIFFQQKFHFCK